MRVVIYSDLDGSLLDHDGYSFDGAREALDEIRRREVPLVPVTSKTRSEVEALRRRLGLDGPFVVENGGGIFFPEPDGTLQELALGPTYAEIREFVESDGRAFGIRGFGDMDVDEIVERTGLARHAAREAARRDFSEPFLLGEPERLDDLVRHAAAAGLAIVRGGRFHHLIGADVDKGVAVRRLRELFEEHLGPHCSIGVGDGPNDAPMLSEVDVPCVIPNPAGAELRFDGAHVAPRPGSHGWGALIVTILARLSPDSLSSEE